MEITRTIDSDDQRADTEIEVTPEMVEAGYDCIWHAPLDDLLSEEAKELVVEIYRAMRRASPKSQHGGDQLGR